MKDVFYSKNKLNKAGQLARTFIQSKLTLLLIVGILLFVDLIATRKEFVARHAVFALIVIAADFVAHQAQIEFFLHL
ncbi:hypothetical protein, partial [Legionella sp. 29fVS95]|uniref:hypothetical protein n=1 Tax=Legionella sp. 29fVS95 TaxID=3402813 RepID=UPI003AF44E3E